MLVSGNPRLRLQPSPDGPFGAFHRISEMGEILSGAAFPAEAPRNGGQTLSMRLQEWLDTEVRPFRDKPISWISQYHFFRDPMRPTYSDTSCFFSPAVGAAYFGAIHMAWPAPLVWLSLPIMWLVGLTISYGWMKSGIWKRLEIS